jgi:hypothetical protein
MKNLLKICILLLISGYVKAQNVGINNIDPKVSLDVTGSIAHRSLIVEPYLNNVNLPPNISFLIISGNGATDLINILDPETFVDGRRLVIYNSSDFNAYFNGYNISTGETKEFICRSPGGWSYIRGDDPILFNGWMLFGNEGTIPSYNYIGTNDDVSLIFKTNFQERMQITNDGRIGIGGYPEENIKEEIFNNSLYTTLKLENTIPSNSEFLETKVLDAHHNGEQNGNRIAGKFVSDGGDLTLGRNIGISTYATTSAEPGIALYAETQGFGAVAGQFKATGAGGIAAHFDNGVVIVDERLGINTSPVNTTLLDINNNYKSSAAKIVTDYNSSSNLKGIDVSVKNPGQGGVTGLYIDADDSPSDFAIIADGNNAFNGIVSIGTMDPAAGYKLNVDGKIIAEELRIQNSTAWPDYVFETDYSLQPLDKVSEFIRENKHLPEVPSAKDIEQNGIIVGEMQATLLKKIEELTLYIIEQDKRISQLENRLSGSSKLGK